MADGQLILAAGALLTAGLVASLVAVRLSVPSLVLFLGVGMLLGSDALGWITFSDYRLARTIGVIALALVLFEGGLTSGLVHIRPVVGGAVSLATIGTVLTAAVVGFAAAALFGLSIKEGLLLGAILSSTDGAAIFALLRGFDRLLSLATGIPVHVAEDPLSCVAIGTGRALEEFPTIRASENLVAVYG